MCQRPVICIFSHPSGTDRGSWWQRFRNLQRTYPAFARGKEASIKQIHFCDNWLSRWCCQVRFWQPVHSISMVHLQILSSHFCRKPCSLPLYAPIFLSRTSALSPPSNTWNYRFVVGHLNLHCGDCISSEAHGEKQNHTTIGHSINFHLIRKLQT